MNIELSDDQKKAVDKILSGQNVFVSGPGGSGKSTLIRHIVNTVNKRIQVCAMTGCAANLLSCNARTLHSWGGLGIKTSESGELAKKILKNFFLKKRWISTQILIVDEVSMMSKKVFEDLDYIGRTIRKRMSTRFGGLQLVFLGDFFQLPPVGNSDEEDTSKFCFESNIWFETFLKENHVVLNNIYRQQGDMEYANILSQIRVGVITKKSYEKLVDVQKEYMTKKERNDYHPTRIYPTKKKTNEKNSEEFNKLTGETHKFTLSYVYDIEPKFSKELPSIFSKVYSQEEKTNELQNLESSLICDSTVNLKVGSHVMYIINNPNIEKVNGSQGIIIGFNVLGNPIVRFRDGSEHTINYHVWESERIPGIGVSQIPLILSWAITIHKSQGVTLESAEIDVGNDVFECGQTYVAMSRIKSLDGLYLKSFNVGKIKTHKRAKDFYEQLEKK